MALDDSSNKIYCFSFFDFETGEAILRECNQSMIKKLLPFDSK
jgi:hypothetical protein